MNGFLILRVVDLEEILVKLNRFLSSFPGELEIEGRMPSSVICILTYHIYVLFHILVLVLSLGRPLLVMILAQKNWEVRCLFLGFLAQLLAFIVFSLLFHFTLKLEWSVILVVVCF